MTMGWQGWRPARGTTRFQQRSSRPISRTRQTQHPRQQRLPPFVTALMLTGAFLAAMILVKSLIIEQHAHSARTKDEDLSILPTLQQYPHASFLWNESDDSSELPSWFQEYVVWHRDTRKGVTAEHWKEFRYLLVRCVERDRVCGGAADRLYALPAVFYLAHISRRLVFLYWTRPAPLTAFLRPQQIDWRLPEFLVPLLHADAPTHPWSFQRRELDDGTWVRKRERVIAIKSLYQGLGEYYDSVERPSLAQSYHSLWNAAFQPSPPVLRIIRRVMEELQLTANPYVGLHIRSLYQINATQRATELKHAVECAISMAPNATIFVAADAVSSVQYAVSYGTQLGSKMVHRKNHQPPLHLDRGQDFLQVSNDWKHHGVDEYYDVFVDVYLMAASRCVSAGIGGFGVWASQIGMNCLVQRNDAMASCPLMNTHTG